MSRNEKSTLMTRKEFIKKFGLGMLVLFFGLLYMPKTTMAAVTDNLPGGTDPVYIGGTQPDTSSDYLLWINTAEAPGVLYYRESITSSTWKTVASVWS